jgi:ribosomal protein L36
MPSVGSVPVNSILTRNPTTSEPVVELRQLQAITLPIFRGHYDKIFKVRRSLTKFEDSAKIVRRRRCATIVLQCEAS